MPRSTAARPTGIFAVERAGDALVVTPQADLRELAFPQLEAGAREVFDLLGSGAARNVVQDFRRTDYYGSTALEFFVRLWKRVRERGGQMAFCNVSAHEQEVLRLTNLDRLWPLCPSREAALEAVRRNTPV
jgi:anti-anti-sigma factor